ncbi:MAG: hypothetical protein ACP5HZ_10120 [Ferrimicrobium sp.]
MATWFTKARRRLDAYREITPSGRSAWRPAELASQEMRRAPSSPTGHSQRSEQSAARGIDQRG